MAPPDSIIPDIETAIILFMALIGFVTALRVAIKRKTLRLVFGLIASFCLCVVSLYTYILFIDPDITIVTASLGRGVIILLLAGIIALTTLIEGFFNVH